MLFVIDRDPRELAAFERLRSRRFGADYRVMGERSPEVGLDRPVADKIVETYDPDPLVETRDRPALCGIEVYERTATVLQPG